MRVAVIGAGIADGFHYGDRRIRTLPGAITVNADNSSSPRLAIPHSRRPEYSRVLFGCGVNDVSPQRFGGKAQGSENTLAG